MASKAESIVSFSPNAKINYVLQR